MEAGGLLPRQPPQGPPGTAPGPISVCVGQAPNTNTNNNNVNNLQNSVLAQSAGIHDLNAAGQLNITSQQLQLQQQMGQAPGMGGTHPQEAGGRRSSKKKDRKLST